MPTAVIQHDLEAGQLVMSAVHDMLFSRATGWRARARTPCLEGGLLARICAVVLQACQLGSCRHNWVDEVGLIVVGHPLQNLHTTGICSSTVFSKSSGALGCRGEYRLQEW